MNKSRFKLAFYQIGIGLGVIVIVAFVTGQILMPIFFGRPKTIEVPNVLNMPSSQATSILTRNKLHGIVRDSIWSDKLDNGIVISQKPEAGEFIKPDGSVYLITSRGSKFVKVPNLVGKGVQAAWLTLRNLGLGFSVADSLYSEIYPRNMVVRTAPVSGQNVEKNSKIRLYISKGRAEAFVPANVIDDFDF